MSETEPEVHYVATVTGKVRKLNPNESATVHPETGEPEYTSNEQGKFIYPPRHHLRVVRLVEE